MAGAFSLSFRETSGGENCREAKSKGDEGDNGRERTAELPGNNRGSGRRGVLAAIGLDDAVAHEKSRRRS
ncbi:hypothetical protein Pla52o_27430 [Novipirellula galeiformis]|uniref:Uncharacterized protein n=1 Tax=Novipirellula galeiformis TaxID=2528004 RepID=A0A5C6CHI8_9BACT|nr:hypothetical protein Pla52o_27430 [Novipirellula galeiformis]